MYNKGLFRKGMALLLTVLLALSLFPVLVFASPQEELTITIDHSNPYHYEGNFGVWVTITDESGQPVPNLPISFKVFEQAGGSVLYNTRTDATGKIVLGFTARAGYSMGVEVVFKGNETYAAKTITEPLFTVVSDSPEPIDCHWDLVDYTVNEQGKISSYTLGLFDSNGALIEDSFILSNGSTSYDFQVTNGLHTFTVEDYSYLKQTYHTTLQTVVEDKIYGDTRSLILTFPMFDLPDIEYGKPYQAAFSLPQFVGITEDQLTSSATFTLPDGTQKPVQYLSSMEDYGGLPFEPGFLIELTAEETAQEGTYTLAFSENKDSAIRSIILPYTTSVTVQKTAFSLTPENNTLTIDPSQVSQGDYVFLNCVASEGYVSTGVVLSAHLADGTELPLSTWPGTEEFYFTMPDQAVTVTATFQKAKLYTVLGDAPTYQRGSGQDLSLRTDGPLSLLTSVCIDDTTLTADAYQKTEDGIIISSQAMEALSEGAHTLTLLFADGSATTTLTVSEAQSSQGGTGTTPTDGTNDPNGPAATPQTSDDLGLAGWGLLLAFSLAGLLIVAFRKKQNTIG